MRSPCCNAEVRVQVADDVREPMSLASLRGAFYYACAACGRPCDPVDHVADAGKMVEDQAAEQSRQSNEAGK